MSNNMLSDFKTSLQTAEMLLSQDMFNAAFQEAANSIGVALPHLYHFGTMQLPFSHRQAVLTEEELYRASLSPETSKGPPNVIFTTGNWIGLFNASSLLDRWAEISPIDVDVIRQRISDVDQLREIRNKVFHGGHQADKQEAEDMVSSARSVMDTFAPILSEHTSFDYNREVESANSQFQQGWYIQSARSASIIFEIVLQDLYIHTYMQADYSTRSTIFEMESIVRTQMKCGDKGFALSNWFKLYGVPKIISAICHWVSLRSLPQLIPCKLCPLTEAVDSIAFIGDNRYRTSRCRRESARFSVCAAGILPEFCAC